MAWTVASMSCSDVAVSVRLSSASMLLPWA
jgi:hypothetical protein